VLSPQPTATPQAVTASKQTTIERRDTPLGPTPMQRVAGPDTDVSFDSTKETTAHHTPHRPFASLLIVLKGKKMIKAC
jgi:hypothetical protein